MLNIEELKVKLMLTLARDRRAMQGQVRSVGFMREYLTLPEDLGAQTLANMSEQHIEELAQSVNIKPKSAVAAFHFYLNDVRYRLLKKDERGIILLENSSSLAVSKLEEEANVKGCITSLKDTGKQTIPLADFEQNQVEALISHLLFTSSEQGISIHEAEAVFVFEDACNMNSWMLLSKEEVMTLVLKQGMLQILEKDHYAIYIN